MNKYLEKIAERLQKHQEEGLAQLDERGGVILHHSMGSGKTLSALTAISRDQAKNPDSRSLFLAPASLVSNFDKERKKHGITINKNKVDIYSYEGATRRSEELKKKHYSLVIGDEIQKMRNGDTQRSKELSDIISRGDKRLLLSGTLQYNQTSDIAPILNLAAGKKVITEDKKEFNNKYIRVTKNRPSLIQRILGQDPGEVSSLRNEKELGKLLKDNIHFYDLKNDSKNADQFPTSTEKYIEVPMSKEQIKYYKFLENDIPFLTRQKIRHNLPLSAKEKMNLNSFSTGVRQASTSIRHLNKNPNSVAYTPKIEKAFSSLKEKMDKDPNFKALAYSNFLGSGVHEYSRRLTEGGIPHSVYTGALTAPQKDELVKSYNSGRNKVLLVSSSGSEGLNLEGTKLVQMLENHYNPSKIKQIQARAIRYQSHSKLPKDERKVETEHYISVFPKPFIGKAPHSIEKYLQDNSSQKDELFDKVKDLMKK